MQTDCKNSHPVEIPLRKKPRFPWTRFGLGLFVFGCLLYIAGTLAGFGARPGDDDVHFDLPEIHSIDIRTSAARVEIVRGGGSVSVSERFAGGVLVRDGALVIDATRARSSYNFARNIAGSAQTLAANWDARRWTFMSSGSVRVYVPHSVENINVTTSSGSIRLTDVDFEIGVLASSSGRISVDGNHAVNASLRARTSSGSIRMGAESGINWGDLQAQSSSGSIQITGMPTPGAATSLTSSSGSVRLNVLGSDRDDFRIAMQSRSGSQRIDGERIPRNTLVLAADASQGPGAINLTSSSGSIRLNFR